MDNSVEVSHFDATSYKIGMTLDNTSTLQLVGIVGVTFTLGPTLWILSNVWDISKETEPSYKFMDWQNVVEHFNIDLK